LASLVFERTDHHEVRGEVVGKGEREFPCLPALDAFFVPVVDLQCDQDADHDKQDLSDGIAQIAAETPLAHEIAPDPSEDSKHRPNAAAARGQVPARSVRSCAA
jgi:hypothetical protein